MKKIFLVISEEILDGELNLNITPCSTLEKAKEVMNEDIEDFLSAEYVKNHYEDEDLSKANIERTETTYFAKASCDDFYLDLKIDEKEVL